MRACVRGCTLLARTADIARRPVPPVADHCVLRPAQPCAALSRCSPMQLRPQTWRAMVAVQCALQRLVRQHSCVCATCSPAAALPVPPPLRALASHHQPTHTAPQHDSRRNSTPRTTNQQTCRRAHQKKQLPLPLQQPQPRRRPCRRAPSRRCGQCSCATQQAESKACWAKSALSAQLTLHASDPLCSTLLMCVRAALDWATASGWLF